MKKILLLFLLLLMFAPLVTAQNGGDEPIVIFVGQGGNEGGSPGYHAPALIPIQAAYYSPHSTVFVNFVYDLGYVSVEIENLTTGEYSQTVVNALAGPMAFPISSSAGHWTITFTFTNGEVFYGEFDINYD